MTQLIQKLKSSIKGKLKKIRLNYLRRQYKFNSEDFVAALTRLGIKQGDVVMVHSAMATFDSFTGKPTEIIAALKNVLGDRGTLLMPTMPFSGTAIEYALAGKMFDVNKTPSRMGMISELFRRSPDVIRSIHPTHPVAAWGCNAVAMIQDHYQCETPCGRNSPFGRLLDYQGKILLLGTGINVLTFFHTIEAILEAEMPFSPFTSETYKLTSKLESDKTLVTETRLFDPKISKTRNIEKLIPYLKKNGHWFETKIGASNVILLNAVDILETVRLMSKEGVFCYAS